MWVCIVSCSSGQQLVYLRLNTPKSLMPSSHCQCRQDLSCLVGGVNLVGDSRRQFSVVINILETEQFCPVSSAGWTHLWTSLEPVSKYDVTIGNHVEIWKLVHTAFWDWTKLFRNFQLPTVFTCRQFSSHRGRGQVLSVSAVWTRHKSYEHDMLGGQTDAAVCDTWCCMKIDGVIEEWSHCWTHWTHWLLNSLIDQFIDWLIDYWLVLLNSFFSLKFELCSLTLNLNLNSFCCIDISCTVDRLQSLYIQPPS